MPRIVFEDIAISLNAATAEDAYALLNRAFETIDAAAEPAMSTHEYEVWDIRTLEPKLLDRGKTSDLY